LAKCLHEYHQRITLGRVAFTPSDLERILYRSRFVKIMVTTWFCWSPKCSFWQNHGGTSRLC